MSYCWNNEGVFGLPYKPIHPLLSAMYSHVSYVKSSPILATGGVRLAEMLFSSSMIALVGSGDEPLFSPRKLRLCNTRNNTLICELNFITAIQAVKLNKKRCVVPPDFASNS